MECHKIKKIGVLLTFQLQTTKIFTICGQIQFSIPDYPNIALER